MAGINSVSFTSPVSPYSADMEEIARRQKMADLLQQQAMAPLPTNRMVGRVAIPTSPLEGLSKLAQAWAASGVRDEATAKQKELVRQLQGDASKWYGSGPQGQALPTSQEGTGSFDMAGTQTPQAPVTQQDRMQHLMTGMTNPFSAPIAQMQLSQLMQPPQRVDLGDKIGLLDAQGNMVGSLPKGATPDAQLKEKGAESRHDRASGSAQLSSQTRLATSDLNPEIVNAKGRIAQLGATRVQTNVNAFTPASEEAQRDFMKSTRATYDQLKQAPVLLDSLEKAKALIPSAKGFMGPGGETLLDAAKFLNNRVGTTINTEGVKSAEELRTRIFFNIMDNLKKMDAQPSQMQQQIMMESLGKLGTDPNALPRVLDAFGDVIRGKVQLHNQEVQGAATKGVKFPYDPTIKIQQIPEFATEAEAAAAGLKPGTRVKIGGKSGVWQ